MKILIKPFALFSIVALLISCKDEQQAKVEKLTESYSKYLDSLTLEKSDEIVSKWNEIEKEFDNKTTALKNEINQLDDKDEFEKKFAAVGIRYEDFKKDILVKKDVNYLALWLLTKRIKEVYVMDIDPLIRQLFERLGVVVRKYDDMKKNPLLRKFIS